MDKRYTISVLKKAGERIKDIKGEIIIGFSGGADSTTLLSAMIKLLGAEKITAVHINHMLRGEDADRDEKFCADFCRDRGVKFICRKIDVRAICGESAVEETARNVRYSAFEEAANKTGAKYIALAHTQSDNLETVLFNLFRGSGLSGMRGIPYSRKCGEATVIRPLIDCTRDEIMGYVGENNLEYVTDSTNADTHYTRNFIRANIVPRIKEIFPNAEKSVGNMSDSAAIDLDFINQCAETFIKENVSDGKADREKLADAHTALRRRVICLLYGGTLELSHIKTAEALILRAGDGREIMPGGVYATAQNGKFYFSTEQKNAPRPEFSFKLNEGAYESPDGFYICVGDGKAPDGYTLVAETDIPRQTLETLNIRSRRAGDKYFFWKMTRTIKKMIGNLPDIAKRIRPVFCAGEDVIWYPGFPAAPFGKYMEREIKIKYYEKTTEVK